MKKKSPVRQMLDAIEAHTPETLKQWVEENKDRILEDERDMVALAWVSGADFEYGVDPENTSEDSERDPQYGYPYFEARYGD
jgi:hypothetical protein